MKFLFVLMIFLFNSVQVCIGSKFIIICNKPEKAYIIDGVAKSSDKLSSKQKVGEGYLISCLEIKNMTIKGEEEVVFSIYNISEKRGSPLVQLKKNNTISFNKCFEDNSIKKQASSVIQSICDFFTEAHNGVIKPQASYIPKGMGKRKFHCGGYIYFDSIRNFVMPSCDYDIVDAVYITDIITTEDVFEKKVAPFSTIGYPDLQNTKLEAGKEYQLVIEFKGELDVCVFTFYILSETENNLLKNE